MRKRQMAKVQLIGREHIKAIGELSISGKCRYCELEKDMTQPSPNLPHGIEPCDSTEENKGRRQLATRGSDRQNWF